MNEQARSLALVVAGMAFVGFLLVKLLMPPGARGPGTRRAMQQIADAKRRARDRSRSVAERAAALREAAVAALADLSRPSLAASFARRAERLEPQAAEGVTLVATALRRASRFQALERLLWRRLAEGDPSTASYPRALQELIDLYEGPLKRAEVGQALRRMRAGPDVSSRVG